VGVYLFTTIAWVIINYVKIIRICSQYIKTSAIKVIQLYETKKSHHAVMIVGRTGAGKTVTWRTLQRSLIHLNKEAKAGFSAVTVSA